MITAAVFELLRRSSYISFAVASALLFTALVFLIFDLVNPTDYGRAYTAYGIWFWLVACFVLVLGVFLFLRERYSKTLNFVANESQSFAHLAKQPDGRVLTQISCHFSVFGKSESAFRLVQVRLAKPYEQSKTHNPFIIVRAQNSHLYSSNHIVPRAASTDDVVSESEASVHMFYEGDITKHVRDKGIHIEVADHMGNWHSVKVPFLRIA